MVLCFSCTDFVFVLKGEGISIEYLFPNLNVVQCIVKGKRCGQLLSMYEENDTKKFFYKKTMCVFLCAYVSVRRN